MFAFKPSCFLCILQQEVGLYPFYIFIFACLLSNQVVSSVYYNRRLDCIHFTFGFFFALVLSNQVVSPVFHHFCKSLSLCMARLIADQSLKRNEKMRSNQLENLIRLEVIGFLSLGFCLCTIYRLCHDFF